jgi:hypothetical protein
VHVKCEISRISTRATCAKQLLAGGPCRSPSLSAAIGDSAAIPPRRFSSAARPRQRPRRGEAIYLWQHAHPNVVITTNCPFCNLPLGFCSEPRGPTSPIPSESFMSLECVKIAAFFSRRFSPRRRHVSAARFFAERSFSFPRICFRIPRVVGLCPLPAGRECELPLGGTTNAPEAAPGHGAVCFVDFPLSIYQPAAELGMRHDGFLDASPAVSPARSLLSLVVNG